MRKYDVVELNDLRAAVTTHWLYGTYFPRNGQNSRTCNSEAEMSKAIEARVQTHMLAGHTATDLYTSETNRRNQEK